MPNFSAAYRDGGFTIIVIISAWCIWKARCIYILGVEPITPFAIISHLDRDCVIVVVLLGFSLWLLNRTKMHSRGAFCMLFIYSHLSCPMVIPQIVGWFPFPHFKCLDNCPRLLFGTSLDARPLGSINGWVQTSMVVEGGLCQEFLLCNLQGVVVGSH